MDPNSDPLRRMLTGSFHLFSSLSLFFTFMYPSSPILLLLFLRLIIAGRQGILKLFRTKKENERI